VLLRPSSEQLADLPVRQALMALLDRAQLITVGTGNGPAAALRADAQVLAPTAPGYQPTMPADLAYDPALAETLLTGAGYVRTAAGWTRDGRPLRVVIGAAEERPEDVRIARDVQRQFAAGGVSAEVTPLSGADLYSPTAEEAPDVVVVSRPAGGDPATMLASDYGCLSTSAGLTPANPAGYCDAGVQPTVDAALSGSLSVSDALVSVEPALWRAAVALPLYQQADVLAVRTELSGVSAGIGFTGPFAGAAFWQRNA
jgi:ABC-type transport system substrate-binding protein